MKLLSRATRSRRGLTLVELMVASAVTVFIIGSICGVYFSVVKEWQRQQGEGDALVATTRACSRVADYAAVAVGTYVTTRFTTNDVLTLNLPLDTAYSGTYVPIWNGGKMQYRSGPWIAFYLSDSTGNINRTGDILWAANVDMSGGSPVVVPDTSWSMYYNLNVGRITPLKSVRFDLDQSGAKPLLTITAVSGYKVGGAEKQLRETRTVCMRNAN